MLDCPDVALIPRLFRARSIQNGSFLLANLLDDVIHLGVPAAKADVLTCAACQLFVEQALQGFENGASDEAISSALAELCDIIGYYNYKVCYGTALIAMVRRGITV